MNICPFIPGPSELLLSCSLAARASFIRDSLIITASSDNMSSLGSLSTSDAVATSLIKGGGGGVKATQNKKG